MSIALTPEHEELRDAVARWLRDHCTREVLRAAVEAEGEPDSPQWRQLVELGWTGLHLPEPAGSGFGLLEACIVLEQAGRALLPGPLLPTALGGAVLAAAAGTDDLVAAVGGGDVVATVAWRAGSLRGSRSAPGLIVDGELSPVPAAGRASLVIASVETDEGVEWWALDRDSLDVEALPSVDGSRRLSRLTARAVPVDDSRRLAGVTDQLVDRLAALLLSAEAAGVAQWCLETAAAHARTRTQFGRPIGQFQAVKHRCADMLVALEQARAAVWDAANAADAVDAAGDADAEQEAALAADVAAAIAPEAAFRLAKDCIQVLGGIGFTWEHDAHLYLKRAMSVRGLLGGQAEWEERVGRRTLDGVRRTATVALPGEAEAMRAKVRETVAQVAALPPGQRRAALVETGLLQPHLPPPAGRGAGPAEQLLISQELARAGVERPNLEVAAWALPTLLDHGTPEQKERWVLPTLRGDVRWCQLFSEPEAGSDLAALRTRAVRAEGGWVVSGQKVWTSMAREAHFGILLARTDPDAPKHKGISFFVVDMHAPGVEIRPLRELTGEAMFNEVFLNDVFVPQDHLVGALNEGWRVARSTLSYERTVMGEGSSYGADLDELVAVAAPASDGSDQVVTAFGHLVAEAQTVAMLGLRTTIRALSGSTGAEASVRKLLGAEHEQRVLEHGMQLIGARSAAPADDEAMRWVHGFLGARCMTIAGGTSEIQRNVIAERVLGLPRDAEG